MATDTLALRRIFRMDLRARVWHLQYFRDAVHKPWIAGLPFARMAACLLAGMSASASLGWADEITLNLLPSNGSVTGPPGSVVGWGYMITNNTADWVQPENLSADVFQHGMPESIFDFPVIAPLGSVTLPFSLTASPSCASPPCGLFDLTWDSTAPIRFLNSGMFTVSSEFFDHNPSDPNAIDLGAAADASAAYSAVVAVPVSNVPEPTLRILVWVGFAALRCAARRPGLRETS